MIEFFETNDLSRYPRLMALQDQLRSDGHGTEFEQRAEALLGRQIDGSDVVVIGDTPADMSCGRGIGARAIGVATGRYSVDDLRACAAAAVFDDLSDTDAVVRAIMGA